MPRSWTPQGPKIFFPNIIFRMIRSPPGYLPNQVVFRVPPHVNKLDIRTYLERLYGVTVTDVRTANYMEKVKWKELARATRSLVRREKRGMGLRPTRVPAYKRAIVTVTEDFRWPDAPDPEKADSATLMGDFQKEKRKERLAERRQKKTLDAEAAAERKEEENATEMRRLMEMLRLSEPPTARVRGGAMLAALRSGADPAKGQSADNEASP